MREGRYLIIKLAHNDADQLKLLRQEMGRLGIESLRKDAVVIEQDWPEYEAVWQMIEDRVKYDAALAGVAL